MYLPSLPSRLCQQALSVFLPFSPCTIRVSTKNKRGQGSGQEQRNLLSFLLSLPLILSSSFFFPPSYFALHTPTSAPGTGYILQRIYLSHSVLLSTSTSPLCRLNGVESRLCFGCTREVGKHERRVRFVREVSVYFEGKYPTSICNLYNLVLTYCAPVLKSAIIFIGKFKR